MAHTRAMKVEGGYKPGMQVRCQDEGTGDSREAEEPKEQAWEGWGAKAQMHKMQCQQVVLSEVRDCGQVCGAEGKKPMLWGHQHIH